MDLRKCSIVFIILLLTACTRQIYPAGYPHSNAQFLGCDSPCENPYYFSYNLPDYYPKRANKAYYQNYDLIRAKR